MIRGDVGRCPGLRMMLRSLSVNLGFQHEKLAFCSYGEVSGVELPSPCPCLSGCLQTVAATDCIGATMVGCYGYSTRAKYTLTVMAVVVSLVRSFSVLPSHSITSDSCTGISSASSTTSSVRGSSSARWLGGSGVSPPTSNASGFWIRISCWD